MCLDTEIICQTKKQRSSFFFVVIYSTDFWGPRVLPPLINSGLYVALTTAGRVETIIGA